MIPVELGMIAAAERELGRPFTAEEMKLIDLPVTVDGLKIVVEVLREADAEKAPPGRGRWE
jgi:hypothetical protein